MDSITIEGIPAYNGDYELDMTYFTNRELHLIKKVAGVRAGELSEAFEAGDNDLMVAIAAIAIQRKQGKEPNLDALWDAPSGKFTFNIAETEETPEDESIPLSTEPEPSAKLNGSLPDDGATSRDSSVPPESVLHRIGTQG